MKSFQTLLLFSPIMHMKATSETEQSVCTLQYKIEDIGQVFPKNE